jgi:hypothetical protein
LTDVFGQSATSLDVISYEVHVTSPRELARVLTTASAVVVAVCIVILTTRVMISGLPLVVEQQKTYDSADIASRVQRVLLDREPRGGWSTATCPSGVTIKSGVTFSCEVDLNGKNKSVQVTVTNTDSGEFEVSDLGK